MNRLELLIYNLVKDRPVLKQLIVDIYQNTLALVPQKPIVTSLPYQVRPGFFYGFHDKSPFSSDGRFLLAHRNLVGDRSLRPGDAAEVGFFYGEDWSQFNLLVQQRGIGSWARCCSGKDRTMWSLTRSSRANHERR